MSFVPESHPLLVEPRTSDASPATAGAATSPSGRSWVKLAAVGAVGLGAVVGVVSLLPTDHVNKTYAALQAKAARATSPDAATAAVAAVDDSVEEAIDYDAVSAEQLWRHLDHPDNVLSFVRFHMLKEMNITEDDGELVETLDDEYFTGLSCSMYDDDGEYPNPQCIKGDNLTCTTGIESNYYYNQTCHHACSESWGVPCGWQGLKNLPSVCDDRTTGPSEFVATFPGQAKNQAPDNVNMQNIFVPTSDLTSGRWYWACNVHAFCYECVDDDNVVDDYCKATVIRSKSMYAPSAVYKDLDTYWCNQTIFDAIDAGTYCGYDANHLWQCQWNDEVA